MVACTESADDIVQDTFLVLYQTLEKGVNLDYPGTWLYKVTYNKSLDALKRRQRHLPLEAVEPTQAEASEPELSEKEALVRTLLAKLKPRERALLVMYSEQCSYKEMADTTGLHYASVGKTLFRALATLEKHLKQHGYETP